MLRNRLRIVIIPPFLFLLGLGIVLPGRADVVILRDGFTLHGVYGKEQEYFTDSTGKNIRVAKINGLTAVDDGPRWVIFSVHSQQKAEIDNKTNIRADHLILTREFYAKPSANLPQSGDVIGPTEFDKDWKRWMRLRSTEIPKLNIQQELTWLSPYGMRVDSRSFALVQWYRTNEFPPEKIKSLILEHKVIKGNQDFGPRLKIVQFFVQADQLDFAERELNELAGEFPAETEKLNDMRKKITYLRQEKLVDEIELACNAGRHRAAQELLARLPKAELDPALLRRATALQAKYEGKKVTVPTIDRYLTELTDLLPASAPLFLKEATAVIRSELHEDELTRLESFAIQTEQAQREWKAGRDGQKPENLLALAISGWLLGKNAADPKPEYAERLWQGRNILVSYLRSEFLGERKQMLAKYLSSSEAVAFDVLAQMVGQIPPPLADAKVEAGKVYKHTVDKTPRQPKGLDYFVILPPEYSHSRNWPLLILLNDPVQKIPDLLDSMKELAGRNGYILAALDWTGGLPARYNYTPEEQPTVLRALRDVKRRYSVDSDRVFLFGHGEGATMAFDIGLAHPDLFAGIVPMGPQFNWNIHVETWRNAQYLPMYFIMGSLSGLATEMSRRLLERWLPRGYPVITVVYKGRFNEWFGVELPTMFDWMNRKRRIHGYPQMGKVGFGSDGEEFRSLRLSDDRFYWLSHGGLQDRMIWTPDKKFGTVFGAKLYGRITEGNNVQVTATGVKSVTVWFTRNMIDFEKPVQIAVNGKLPWLNGGKPLKPNIETMLEDIHERMDRQKVFVASVTFSNP